MLSHAAVIARELGIPCVIRVAKATSVLREGETVLVDGTGARVVRQVNAPSLDIAPTTGSSETRDPLLFNAEDLPDRHSAGRKAEGLAMLNGRGLLVPTFRVVPADVCARLTTGETAPEDLANQILSAFPGCRLSIRSSSTIEDLDDGTAAGVYHSEVDVDPTIPSLVQAIGSVIRSQGGERARAYHDRAGRSHEAPFALLVAPYLEFVHQGVAVSHSPHNPERVLVEAWESNGRGGCPDGTSELWQFAHEGLRHRGSPRTRIPYLTSSVRELARETLLISEAMGGPVEVEWGRQDAEIVYLQARMLHTGIGQDE